MMPSALKYSFIMSSALIYSAHAFVCVCLYVPCGRLLGGADLLALVYGVLL